MLFFLKTSESIEWPTTYTFRPFIGQEPEVAVKIPFEKTEQILSAKLSEVCVYQRKCLILKIQVKGEMNAA